MARETPLYARFNSGEISPLLEGRVDLPWYGGAAREMVNFRATPQGAAVKRPGTRYVANTKSNAAERLLRFEYSTSQAYMLTLGDGYCRFCRNKGQIVSGTPVEIVTPWTAAADLFQLRYTQSADYLFGFHPSFAPRQITRSSHTAWSVARVALEDGPYFAEEPDSITLTFGATSGSTSCTASAALFAASDTYGTNGTGDFNRHIRVHDGTNWKWAEITAYTSTTVVTVTLHGTLGGVGPHTRRQMGFYSSTTGFPRCGVFHGGRLVMAGAAGDPGRIDGSAVDDFLLFTPGSADSDAISFAISDNQVPTVLWLVSDTVLLAGAAGKVHRIGTPDQESPLTPSNVNAKKAVGQRVAPLHPLEVDDAVLFVTASRAKIHALQQVDFNRWTAADVQLRATHLFGRNRAIRDIAWQGEPWSLMWACRADGGVAAMSWLPEEQVRAWHRHVFGASSAGDAVVESVCTIPSATEGAPDELWMIVKRTINGATKRTIEVLEDDYDPFDNPDTAWFLDCALQLDNTVAQTLTPGTGATVKGTTGVTFTAGGAVFSSGDVGRRIHYRYSETDQMANTVTWSMAVALITGYSSSTVVSATIEAAWPSTAAIASGGWHLTATGVSGLSHLEGESVGVLGDGAVLDDATVSGGAITFEKPCSRATVGLRYTARLKMVRPEAGAQQGTSQGQRKRIRSLTVRLASTGTMKIGADLDNLDSLRFRDPSVPMGEAPPLFTGDVDAGFPGDWESEGTLYLVHDEPLPCFLVGVAPRMTTNEGI